MKLSFFREISIDIRRNVLRILKVSTGECFGKRNAEGRRLLELCDKKELWWQALCFIRQTKGKSFIVLLDVKQKLILCVWEKNIESK